MRQGRQDGACSSSASATTARPASRRAVLARINQADLLVGGRRHLELFPEGPAERLVIAGGLDEVLQRIDAASGSAGWWSWPPATRATTGSGRTSPAASVRTASRSCRTSRRWRWRSPGSAWPGRTPRSCRRTVARWTAAIQAARGARKLAVLTDDENTPSAVARALLDAGADDCPAWVFEHLGGPREAATQATLGELAGRSFAPLNVLVVPSVLSGVTCPIAAQGFGLPESAYEHSAGLITKPEVRAVSLSKLRLRPGGVLWDVGAGSGSVSIEAAGLVPDLSVYAIERSAQQIKMLRAQRRAARPRRAGWRSWTARRLTSSPRLPDPTAVFVGGSGGRLTDILDVAHARISRPGRIVANLVTYENVATMLAWANRNALQPEVVQLSVVARRRHPRHDPTPGREPGHHRDGRRMTTERGARLIGVGVGPGDPELLTLKAVRADPRGRCGLRAGSPAGRSEPGVGDRRRAPGPSSGSR